MKTLFSPEAQKRLKSIRLLALDVDGILTDGSLVGSEMTRTFFVRDGFGIKLLLREGFPVSWISAGESADVQERAKLLGVEHAYFGNEEKMASFNDVCSKLEIDPSEALYAGDELFDIPVLEAAGIGVTVPSAPLAVRNRCDFVTELEGGKGAVREICDAIRKAQSLGPYSDEI